MSIYQQLDDFNDSTPPGSRVFVETGNRWIETEICGFAFILGDELLVRVNGIVGAIPLDAIRMPTNDGDSICPVCNGQGCLPEAVQAWDCGQEPPDCRFCSDGIMGTMQRTAMIDLARNEAAIANPTP